MPTRSRIAPGLDLPRLAEGVRDHKVWISLGRIDTDEDAVTWSNDFGWIVDVTFHGGRLEGVGPVPCRVSSFMAGAVPPIEKGAEIIAVLPDGDPNGSPVIIGYVHSMTDRPPPQTQQDADGRLYVSSPRNALWSMNNIDLTAQTIRLFAAVIELGEEIGGASAASQPFIRGDDFVAYFSIFLFAIDTWAIALELAVGVPSAPIRLATQQLREQLVRGSILSEVVRGV